jgi:hypothetical protein
LLSYLERIRKINEDIAEAEILRRQELPAVIDQVRELIKIYRLTASDAGFPNAAIETKTVLDSARNATSIQASADAGTVYELPSGLVSYIRGVRAAAFKAELNALIADGRSPEEFKKPGIKVAGRWQVRR